MSTRSLVGIKSESGFIGRYVHSDGYPEGMLPDLQKLIERDGAKVVGDTILSADKGGWSTLSTVLSGNYLGEDRAELVEGYGLKYLDSPASKPITLESIKGGDSWMEYAYFIDVSDGPEQGTIYWCDLLGDEKYVMKTLSREEVFSSGS